MDVLRSARTVRGGDGMTKREFLDIVFALAPTEANAIMDAFDEYVESSEPHWIPVEQELPEEETDVLVTVHFLGLKRTHRNGWNEHIKETFYVEVASHINGEWGSASDEYKIAKDRHKVVAWMPLPEPYKGVTE